MINVVNLGFDYEEMPLLKKINFGLQAGELLHIKGENGAGKTTLIRLLAGLIEPQTGHIAWNGAPNAEAGHLSLVGHKSGLSDVLSIYENYRSYPGLNDERLAHLIQKAGMRDYAYDRWLGSLSAGQRKRAALLRLKIEKKPLWLLDEPFVALDTKGMHYLTGIMTAHLNNGGTIILSSHQSLPNVFFPCQEYTL